jgi:hypothetical protein
MLSHVLLRTTMLVMNPSTVMIGEAAVAIHSLMCDSFKGNGGERGMEHEKA